ncbi:MAG: hypothetical protein ABS944_16380 [Solibacillus sp.]|uniref:phage tail fiber protein n=1 Tax=Solibacillus sp. TaxID=1909654 RepID=UPI003316404F
MNHMTEYLKHKVITDNLISRQAYVALFNENNEIVQTSYVRQSVTFNTPANGQASNNADILFPIANENWGNVTHIGIYDAITGGNLLFKSPAEFIKTIDISSQYKVPKNYLIVRLR